MKIGAMDGVKMYGLKSVAYSLRQRIANKRIRAQRQRPQKRKTLAFFTCEEVPRQTVSSAKAQFVADLPPSTRSEPDPRR
jgi:hypothetical protein